MSKRLQVVLPEDEYEEMERIARRSRMTLSAWVRESLRRARLFQPSVDTGRKLEVVRSAVGHTFPTGDIDQMLVEIERGYTA